jgi:hypothetical protein
VTGAHGRWLSLVAALVAALPLAVFYFASFHQLPVQYRALLTAGCLAILSSGIAVLVPFVSQLGRWRAGFGTAAVTATAILSYQSGDFQSAHAQGALAHLFALGGSLLVGLAAAVIVFTVLGRAPAQSSSGGNTAGDALSVLRSQWPLLGILACILLVIVYWSQIQTERVYYWDYLVYWRKTDELYRLLSAGSFMDAAKLAIAQYAQDYTMLPAIVPALIAFARGSADRITYVIIITVVYAVPAYFLVHALGTRLAGTRGKPLQPRWYAGLLSILTLLIAFPLFLDRVLDLMPDIGGVALVVIALFLATDVISLIVTPTTAEQRSPDLARLARLCLALGGLLCLMVFFRRWYVFAAVGICAAGLVLICWEAAANREARQRIVGHLHIPVILITASALTFISWLLIDWSAQPGQHNYADLYASYAFGFKVNHRLFSVAFGLIPPALALLGLLWTGIVAQERRLLWLLVLSTAISCLLFMQVQSPSQHHYYLLMPLFGAGIVTLSLRMQLRWGPVAAVALAVLLLMGSATVSRLPDSIRKDYKPFHDLRSWLPDKQAGSEGLVTMAKWLMSEENRSRKFCLIASGTTINQSIMFELWQIAPGIPPFVFADRMVFLGEVDSRDGPPGGGFDQCEIALVAWPPQLHLPKGHQYSVELPATDLMENTGIGAAFQRLPQTFGLVPGIEVRAFRKLREPSEAEYAELVQRFHAARMDAQ